MTRILVTTTSFQDTPGDHHQALADTGWEIVTARGPLSEEDTLAAVGDVDGYICGDDLISRAVLEKARPRLQVLSKYGIGVDKIDVAACTEMGLPLLFTPGVNHTTVAEHTFLLLLALEKHLLFHTDSTRSGGWQRQTVVNCWARQSASSAWVASARKWPSGQLLLGCGRWAMTSTGTRPSPPNTR